VIVLADKDSKNFHDEQAHYKRNLQNLMVFECMDDIIAKTTVFRLFFNTLYYTNLSLYQIIIVSLHHVMKKVQKNKLN